MPCLYFDVYFEVSSSSSPIQQYISRKISEYPQTVITVHNMYQRDRQIYQFDKENVHCKYIPFSSWSTVNRFIRYMALSNKVMLLKIAHFLENAFKIRSEKIANMNI